MKQMTQKALLAAAALGFAHAGLAQPYPDHPVRIIVPFPPGGNVDQSARIIAHSLTEALGQSFVVENKAGASGMVGSDMVAKARPDGYTLLVSSNSAISIVPLTNPNAPYEPLRDFSMIGMLALTPMVIVVNPDVPAKSVTELIALAKKKPGQLAVATPSSGSINHMAIELFQASTGTKFNLVHYKGNAPAVNDVLGGHVQLSFDQLTSSLPHIKAGKLRALAVTSAKRAPELPETPTLDEAGYPGLQAVTFTAMVAPKGTPPEIVNKLNAAINEALKTPAVQERFAGIGAQVNGTTPDEFYRFLQSEQARWSKVIKNANIKSE
ncbi:tripartite tricarboxylate transporter substrate binding protein [Pigmentiphaga soli]|uniref:Tripartite tricarboxylate transporter substrate binding protein n=1 Tax=Pigmentiphaga soli TaxID=1007095 RepID=A0ABP8HLF2_9BURK